MGRPPKIDFNELVKLHDQGLRPTEIAKRIGVSRSAVSRAIDKLDLRAMKESATKVKQPLVVRTVKLDSLDSHDNAVVKHGIDAVEQLQQINREALELLSQAQVQNRPDTKVRVLAEIRNQLKFQLEILSELHNIQEVSKWKETVLDTIAKISPEVRDAIVSELAKTNALRESI